MLDTAPVVATRPDFEAVFLNSMFSQMFTGIDGEGPFGGNGPGGVWRSFLTDEYAKLRAEVWESVYHQPGTSGSDDQH